MKSFAHLLLAGAALVSTQAHGQGLLAIGQNQDYRQNIPLTFKVTAGGGYDNFHYKNPSPGQQDVSSFYLQGGLGLNYAESDRVTKWNVDTSFSALRYLDDANLGDKLYYNARAAFNITSDISRRLKVTDNFYLAYEIEPDFATGASAGVRAGQYLYGYNNFAVAYAWTERFASTTGYTIDGIHYMDDTLGTSFENRISHIISQQFSYKKSRTTTLTAEYRYGITNYQNQPTTAGVANADYRSHYLLAGVDQAWSNTTTGSLRAGAEFYESDRASKTAPYVEGSVNYALSRQTMVRWYGQAGFDGSQLGQYDSRYSYRTGITASNKVSDKLSVNAGVHYVHSSFKGNIIVPSASENELNLTAGINYSITKNIGVEASYSHTTISSDANFGDYNRNHVSLGLNATF